MAQTTRKPIPVAIDVPLTASQINNLVEFIEFEFIEMVRRDEYIDNIDYVVDMMNALQVLRAFKSQQEREKQSSVFNEEKK